MNDKQESAPDKSQDDLAAVHAKPRKRGAPWLLGGLVLLLLFALISQQALYVWTVITPDTASDTLFLYALSSLNFVAFIIFSFIFVRNLLKLRSERRASQFGSKIKTRLIVYFIAVSLLPITAMAAFSYFFLNRSLDKWFSGLPEDVVAEAKRAAEVDATFQAADLRQRAEAVAASIASVSAPDEATLQRLLTGGGFAALETVAPDGAWRRVLRPNLLAPSALPVEVERQFVAWRTREAVTEEVGAAGRYNVAAVPLTDGGQLMVAAERRVNAHLAQVLAGAENFESLRTEQRKIRSLGLSVLGLLTLLLLFAATWAAIHLSRGIGTQVKALATAADEVARGNLAHRVSTVTDDELVLLAASFNQMTEQLAENRGRIDASAAALREINLALEERRAYIETVLETLSTGVVSLDGRDRVTTINAAAAAMLGLEGAPTAVNRVAGAPLADVISAENFAVLIRLIRRARRAGSAADQVELGHQPMTPAAPAAGENGAPQREPPPPRPAPFPVALTATAFGGDRAANRGGRGVVIMLEDLTELLAAQRAAAWSEVARRMAHEIKNPLTPIQLSAERIARHFQRTFEAETAASNNEGRDELARVAGVVADCTETITREVAGLKAMVDEFARFSRLPQVRPEIADLNEIVRQSVALYEDRRDDVRLEVRLAQALPKGLLDGEQLRRVFVNLIENSLEAFDEADSDSGGAAGVERRVTVATAYDPARALLRAEVADTGHGIAAGDLPLLFQPYFSTRRRGTGLGLAIVQRIITDHGGRIRAGANHPRGAKFMIELPIADSLAREPEQEDEAALAVAAGVAPSANHPDHV